MKKAIALLIALAAWASPIHAASAQTETKTEVSLPSTIDSNYVAEVSEPIDVSKNGRQQGIVRPTLSQIQPIRKNELHTDKVDGRDYSKEEVQSLIIQYSQQYGISANLPLRIANCESGFRYDARNKTSTASGVFQWLASSWANQPDGKLGVSVFDAEANVRAAIWLIANGKTSPWNASKSCWNR